MLDSQDLRVLKLCSPIEDTIHVCNGILFDACSIWLSDRSTYLACKWRLAYNTIIELHGKGKHLYIEVSSVETSKPTYYISTNIIKNNENKYSIIQHK